MTTIYMLLRDLELELDTLSVVGNHPLTTGSQPR